METIIDTNIERKTISPWNVAIKWGVIGALLGIVQTLVEHVIKEGKMNQEGAGIKFFVGLAIAVFAITMCIKEHRDKDNEGFISFGRAFKAGFYASIIAVSIMTLFTFIYFSFIVDYDLMMAETLGKSIAQMKKKGMDDPQIKQGIEMSKKFTSKGFLVSLTFIFGLIFDTIIALICAAIQKKTPTQYA